MGRKRRFLDAQGQTLFEYLTLLMLVGGIGIAVISLVAPGWARFMRAVLKALISPYTT